MQQWQRCRRAEVPAINGQRNFLGRRRLNNSGGAVPTTVARTGSKVKVKGPAPCVTGLARIGDGNGIRQGCARSGDCAEIGLQQAQTGAAGSRMEVVALDGH